MNEYKTIQMIHEDLELIKRDVAELKALFSQPLKPDVVKKIGEARQRMKKTAISHEDLKKEFGV